MATYDAGADHYDDDDGLSFRSRHGARTVDRLGLRAGDLVVEVCCGTGASALPAAERADPEGWVIAVDVSEGMLTRARAKAMP
jgi:ubiquinone/menaquinone biosynthesis C-methylase UbiE